MAAYAEADIADYWIVNLAGGQLLVHREPSPDGYGTVQTLGRGDHISPLAVPDLTIAVSDILI